MECSADSGAMGAEALSAALLAIDEQIVTDAVAGLAAVAGLLRQAMAMGDEGLVMRARLQHARLSMRIGEITGVAREVSDILQWAAQHGERQLEARAHMLFANIHELSGDAARKTGARAERGRTARRDRHRPPSRSRLAPGSVTRWPRPARWTLRGCNTSRPRSWPGKHSGGTC
nr:hypothetical protein GCM10020092_028780 [Actinoplanes digitatis]